MRKGLKLQFDNFTFKASTCNKILTDLIETFRCLAFACSPDLPLGLSDGIKNVKTGNIPSR